MRDEGAASTSREGGTEERDGRVLAAIAKLKKVRISCIMVELSRKSCVMARSLAQEVAPRPFPNIPRPHGGDGRRPPARLLRARRGRNPVLSPQLRIFRKGVTAAEVAPGLYIGCAAAAKNREGLVGAGITHIVNASPVVPCYHREDIEYLAVDIHDSATEDLSGETLPQAPCGPNPIALGRGPSLRPPARAPPPLSPPRPQRTSRRCRRSSTRGAPRGPYSSTATPGCRGRPPSWRRT